MAGNVIEELIIQVTHQVDEKPLREAAKKARTEAKSFRKAWLDADKAVKKAHDDLSKATTDEAKVQAAAAIQAAEKTADAARKAMLSAEKAAEDAGKAAKDAAKKNSDAAEKFKGKWTKAGKFVAGAIIGAFAVGGAALASFVSSSIDAAREIETWAQKVGAGREELQALEIAAESYGIEQDKVREGVKTLRENLGEMARIGTGPAVDALGSLGLKLEDIHGLDVEGQMALLSDALLDVEDPAKRLSIAIELMGEDGAALIPILNEGSDEIRSVGDAARDSGRIMSDELVESTLEVDKKFKALRGELTAVGNNVLQKLLPAIEKAVDKTSEWIDENEEFIEQDIPRLVEETVVPVLELAGAFATIATAIIDAKNALDDFIETSDSPVVKRLAQAAGVVVNPGKAVQQAAEAGREALLGAITGPTHEFEDIGTVETRGGVQFSSDVAEAEAARRAEKAEASAGRKKAAAAFEEKELRKTRGGGGKSAKERQAERELREALFHVTTTGLEEALRIQAKQAGATDLALEKAVRAAAESFVGGASEKVALEAGTKKLQGLTGVDLSKRRSDPLLSMLFGEDHLPDVPVSELERGQQPQVLVSTINNTFNVTVNNDIDGTGEPLVVAERVTDTFRALPDELDKVSKFSKVNFAR